MFRKLIDNHFKEIKDQIGKDIILVYKGFPISFLKTVFNKIPPVIESSSFLTDDKIDLEKIRSSTLLLISKIQGIESRPCSSMIFEQFSLLEKNINLELFPNKFLIIANNLYKEFPNQSDVNFIDIESKIETNQSFEENELFNYFYANSIIVDDVNYIQYYDLKSYNQNVSQINFFNPVSFEDINFIEIYTENIPPDYVTFHSLDNSYNKFKDSIFTGKIDLPINLITDRSALLNKENSNELKILNYIFKTNDFEINFYRNKTYLGDYVAKDIEQRHNHSVKTMEKFFTPRMDDPDRWNFIEDYFLGKDVLGET